MEYLQSTLGTFVFDIFICWKLLGSNHKLASMMTLISTLSCSVTDEKYKSQCSKLKIHKRMYNNVSRFSTSPAISYHLDSTHHCIVNLWKSCVYSILLSRYSIILPHDDVINWKHLPRFWQFVRGNHRSPVNFPAQSVASDFIDEDSVNLKVIFQYRYSLIWTSKEFSTVSDLLLETLILPVQWHMGNYHTVITPWWDHNNTT